MVFLWGGFYNSEVYTFPQSYKNLIIRMALDHNMVPKSKIASKINQASKILFSKGHLVIAELSYPGLLTSIFHLA